LKKRKDREKRIRKQRNIQHNLAEQRWRLDVFFEDRWITAKRYRRTSQIEAHVEETERRRKAGETIVKGRVIDEKTGEIIRTIEASKAKGALPDKFEGKPESAKKGFLDRFKK